MSEPKTCRKKPVHVKAMQWDGAAEVITVEPAEVPHDC